MTPADIGIDAAVRLKRTGMGHVHAVFTHAVYLCTPGGLVVLSTTQVPRGPLHVRFARLPVAASGEPVTVDTLSLRIGSDRYPLEAPAWSPCLPPASSLATARRMAEQWLPDLGAALDLDSTGSASRTKLPGGALDALRGGRLEELAAIIGGRGPGLTPAGDDVLAGTLLVACAIGDMTSDVLMRCARAAATNDIASAFLACAAHGRCIEPAHELLTGLARADHPTVRSATAGLRGFGASSGAALTYGIRTALLGLPRRAGSEDKARRSLRSDVP